MTATVFDLPTTRSFAENTIDRFGLDDRIDFSPGDYHTDAVPAGFDVAWLSHILHAEGEEGCRTILAKGVAALQPGGLLLVQEFILNDEKDGPVFPALFSLNMLLGTGAGRCLCAEGAGGHDVGGRTCRGAAPAGRTAQRRRDNGGSEALA